MLNKYLEAIENLGQTDCHYGHDCVSCKEKAGECSKKKAVKTLQSLVKKYETLERKLNNHEG